MGQPGSRRAALGALLGAGALGVSEAAIARKKRGRGKNGKGGVSAQAVCPPPAHGVNRSNCNYTDDDFSRQDISSSVYKNTIFRRTKLAGTLLNSSNANGANFRDADLCGAILHSSNLRNADFQGAFLAFADLHSSSCRGANFTASTFWCETIDCNGNVRNDDCLGGAPFGLCCVDEGCGGDETCVDHQCVPILM